MPIIRPPRPRPHPGGPRPAGDGADPLAVLEVIDRLEVGPVTVTPKGLRMPYRAECGAHQSTCELAVDYDLKVFDPEAAADRNLAAMIGAQLALNYGLFCRHIRFLGSFDEVDQTFLRAMLSKVAREIYVKKLLDPPFVDGPWRGLPALQRSDYVRADVRFAGGGPIADGVPGLEEPAALAGAWKVDRGRFAVLSQGDTPGLLTHGLLEELGLESHLIFVDPRIGRGGPRGPAYPHFRREIPHTARVRIDSQALRSWMCELLRFARPDAFELWSQATSIFASLPLLRRRKVGRLLTPGLFDSTRRLWHHGIPNYDGRYQHSRHFDRALSRYFRTKGWGVSQSSLLRSLSDLLAEKILCERYPQLSRLQLACSQPVRSRPEPKPCGICEACRWTVAVMLAVDADPSTRGFDRSRWDEILAAAVRSGFPGDRASVEMVAHLLHERGLIPRPRLGYVNASNHPELLYLRFDPDRSLSEEIPLLLRRPLLETFLEHATGMLKSAGGGWVEIYEDEDLDPAGDEDVFHGPTTGLGPDGRTPGGRTPGGRTPGGRTPGLGGRSGSPDRVQWTSS